MVASRLISTTGPAKPSSRSVRAALPPVMPLPMITIGFPLVGCVTRYILPPGPLNCIGDRPAFERHETGHSARSDALDPGFHAAVADPWRADCGAGGAAVTEVRFLAVPAHFRSDEDGCSQGADTGLT